jgi:hypothetical protein
MSVGAQSNCNAAAKVKVAGQSLIGNAPPLIPYTRRKILMNSIIYIVGLVVVVLVVLSFFGLR